MNDVRKANIIPELKPEGFERLHLLLRQWFSLAILGSLLFLR